MNASPLIAQLAEALRCLPGVGPRSAQRMVLYLLSRNRTGGVRLAAALEAAMQGVGHCETCRNFSETPQCVICADPRRDASLLCVVESPADVLAIEQSGSYVGRFFVLLGHLSPIDGIGPEELGLPQLEKQLAAGGIREVIVATNPTVEGEATAHYIHDLARGSGAVVSRLAHGVPVGGELEYVDGGTLSHAIEGRRPISAGSGGCA